MKHHCLRRGWLTGIVAAMLALPAVKSLAAPDPRELVYVGSGRKNIYAFWLNLTSGALNPVGEVAQLLQPSFLTTSLNRRFLYAITEGRGADSSFVSAYRIDSDSGKLAMLNLQLTGGTGPCYVDVDPTDEDVLVANYGSGSVSVFPIGGQGALGPVSAFIQDHGSSINPQRQEGPHAHCVVTDPDGRFAFVCDLGLDKVMIFKFDPANGSLVANDPAFAPVKPGSGPRHIAFHPNRRYAYVISEMASTLTAFAYDHERGILSEIGDYSLLPKGFKGQSWAAEVAVHPSGNFVYASNRGDDSIVVFGCDPRTGRLTFIERESTSGKTPRNFDIDPTGAFLLAANQDSGTIIVFSIDQKTGRLQPTSGRAMADTPMCVKCLAPDKVLKEAAPVIPVVPASSIVPASPVIPAPPANGTPATPATPESPGTPAAPATPVTPVTPAAPVTPATPAAPVTPTSPATPVTPTTPATPTTPSSFLIPWPAGLQFRVV